MPQTSATAKPRRPFAGFDRESAAYERVKRELLSRAGGKFVVFVGDEMIGPVESFEQALESGYRRFGLGPLYVKQVMIEEPIAETTREI